MVAPRFFLSLLSLALGCTALSAPIDPAKAEAEGRAMAADLRAQKPTESFTSTATLKMRDAKNKRRELTIQFQTIVTTTNWESLYLVQNTNREDVAPLPVLHADSQPNLYRLVTFTRSTDRREEKVELKGAQAMIPLAGTDFWLADLGLEYFHWPEQRFVNTSIRLQRNCKVLESRTAGPAAGGYVRVLSWIDAETGALLMAEAYGANGKLMKVFSLKSFKKVDGNWRLKEMEIRSVEADSRTRLEFDFELK